MALPLLPTSGIKSQADLATLVGVKVIERDIYPGPTASIYAFPGRAVHRNLYRIPVP